LCEVDACLFDIFCTVLDCHSTVTHHVAHPTSKGLLLEVAQGGRYFQRRHHAQRSNSYSSVHAHNSCLTLSQILDDMLTTPRRSHLAGVWGASDREDLDTIWPNLDGTHLHESLEMILNANPLMYQDTTPGLTELKHHVNILALSNGNVRSLLGILWGEIFSSEMFGSYEPNIQVYQSAAYHLSLPLHNTAMIAAYRFDLLVAASVGFKTIYVPRSAEDICGVRESMRSKKDGGKVDLVV
ncbi:hypothetical protein EDB19DRAFT_1634430, partial [Suillus lakei]